MSNDGGTNSHESAAASRWRGWLEPLLLCVLVATIYGAQLTRLPVRGEESRWGVCLMQMIDSGDWVVPRQQGLPYIDRPPLALWAMAPAAIVRGEVDEFTIRLPSLLAIVAMSLVVYCYGRTFLSRFGALAAGLAFATMGQVMQLGRLGENEAVFTLLLCGGLLAWHYGYLRSWPALAWCAGYTLAALATLQKGIQAPAYFVAATGLFLLVKREWRWLFSPWQFVGLALYAGVISLWLVPFYLATDLESAIGVWTRTVTHRFENGSLVEHMLTYPLETFACLLPWSILLLALVRKSVRESLGKLPPQVTFILVALVATYPSVWLASSAKGRYFMPLYPGLALIIGWIAQACATAEPGNAARNVWRRFTEGVALALVVASLTLAAASFLPIEVLAPAAQPPVFAVLFVLASFAVCGLMFWINRARPVQGNTMAVVALAAMLGMAYSGAVINAKAHEANDMSMTVAQLREQLPADAKLVSFGPVDHRFTYYYRDQIPEHIWPTDTAQVEGEVLYFCFDRHRGDTPERRKNGRGLYWEDTPGTLPFEWEPVAELAADRTHETDPETVVVIGRMVRPPGSVAERKGTAVQRE